ncbi:hypothetical protein [Caudoviricetes sp.]|nr:hypothetical protein [Caudoviricetes sp.]
MTRKFYKTRHGLVELTNSQAPASEAEILTAFFDHFEFAEGFAMKTEYIKRWCNYENITTKELYSTLKKAGYTKFDATKSAKIYKKQYKIVCGIRRKA